ncbi:MAG TPA: transketolase C-terminal domain-containing protein [Bacteroidales bacterium]|nr:transketolase C-terminal domain-containing protein [Bacteroidales bacterium]HRZ48672.1 transketolase C-terminal domain-containing protein [Bacteroidales bacterium]
MEPFYSSRGFKATKEGFAEGLEQMGILYPKIVGLGADITASVGMDRFARSFPERFFSLGIAEQNCIGVAAGLALEGLLPVFSTYGVFSALRTTDQIRISLCYNNLHVIIGGAHAGISVGPDGATHQALEDIAVMRVMPNMTVLSPCDATQTALALKAAVEQCNGPVYLRYGRSPVPDFTPPDLAFRVGKGQILHEGNDACILATGHLVWEALQASYALAQQNIACRVVNLHTIKPIDTELIAGCTARFPFLVTAEEHQRSGGLGSAVAEVVTGCPNPVPVVRIGMEDRFGESGSPEELMEKYGLTARHLILAVRKMLR